MPPFFGKFVLNGNKKGIRNKHFHRCGLFFLSADRRISTCPCDAHPCNAITIHKRFCTNSKSGIRKMRITIKTGKN